VLILGSLTGLLLPLLGETYEVDNFSRRHREITDSELLLNAETQRLIQQAVTEENARECHEFCVTGSNLIVSADDAETEERMPGNEHESKHSSFLREAV
jgi:hypothetical protein